MSSSSERVPEAAWSEVEPLAELPALPSGLLGCEVDDVRFVRFGNADGKRGIGGAIGLGEPDEAMAVSFGKDDGGARSACCGRVFRLVRFELERKLGDLTARLSSRCILTPSVKVPADGAMDETLGLLSRLYLEGDIPISADGRWSASGEELRDPALKGDLPLGSTVSIYL
jgi:hypothetical protein